MNAKKCDRCGKLYEPETIIEGYRLTRYSQFNSRYQKKIDLCPECHESLKKWFEQPMF